jgi:hypothetical protein
MSLAIERTLVMNPTYLTALAALVGSALGVLTSLASAWVTQDRHDRAKRLAQDASERQQSYNQFISEASKLYADTLVHNEAEVAAPVSVYALISRMQVLPTPAVVEEAAAVIRKIGDTYCAPNKTFQELRSAMEDHPIYPLRALSEKCREELKKLQSPLINSGHRERALEALTGQARMELLPNVSRRPRRGQRPCPSLLASTPSVGASKSFRS